MRKLRNTASVLVGIVALGPAGPAASQGLDPSVSLDSMPNGIAGVRIRSFIDVFKTRSLFRGVYTAEQPGSGEALVLFEESHFDQLRAVWFRFDQADEGRISGLQFRNSAPVGVEADPCRDGGVRQLRDGSAG